MGGLDIERTLQTYSRPKRTRGMIFFEAEDGSG